MISVDTTNGITITSVGATFEKLPTDILGYLSAQPAGVATIRQAAATTSLCTDVAAFVGDGLSASAVIDWTAGQVRTLEVFRP